MSKIIGIDLGTGNSAVAVMEAGSPKIIVNSEGNRTTPSVIAYDKSGERKVGESAKRQAAINPKTTVHSIKRFIGCTYSDALPYKDKFAYDVVEGKNNTVNVKINDKTLTPQEISAAVLQKMKKTAEDYLGETVTDAVITVPAYFNDSQRTATKEAGEIAGLNVRRIINEPTAASLAFGLDKLDKDMKILVFDSGCGTTDLSVLDLGSGVFEVLSTNGDVFLGGDDIDSLIIDWLADQGKSNFGVDLRKDPMALQRMKEAAEKAKIELSNTTSADINLPYITVVDNIPQHLVTTLTRAQLEKMMQPFINKCIKLCDGVLKKADLTKDQIDEILLVGGTTRIPYVQKMIYDYFGKEGNKSVNPDEAVALGAAIQGAVLNGEQQGIVLLDVTPLNLNITTMGSVATCMIEANTTIPTTKSQIFSTAVDNQPAVDIEITQGNRAMAADNKKLGTFVLDGIAPARRGVPQIEVTFSLDANGILEVTAIDKATGKSQNIRVEGSSGLSKEEVEKMKADAESHADEDKKKTDRLAKLNMAESSIYQTTTLLEEMKDKLTDDQKTSLTTALDNLKAVYDVKDEDRNIESIETAAKELNEVWYKVSAELNKSAEEATQTQEQPAE
jgi:molecular chaperone DnaK